MTRLTKCEKETIILTNEKDNFWNVFTYNKGLQRRFISFAEQYPENCQFTSQNNEGGMTFEIDKGRLSVRLTAPYSEERKKLHRSMVRSMDSTVVEKHPKYTA